MPRKGLELSRTQISEYCKHHGFSNPLNEVKADIEVSDSRAKPDVAPTLGSPKKGKAKGDGRTIVRFEGRRVRPVDPDSFAASIKGILDGLRFAHILSDDTIWHIKLETSQTKVSHFSEEETIIEIDPI